MPRNTKEAGIESEIGKEPILIDLEQILTKNYVVESLRVM